MVVGFHCFARLYDIVRPSDRWRHHNSPANAEAPPGQQDEHALRIQISTVLSVPPSGWIPRLSLVELPTLDPLPILTREEPLLFLELPLKTAPEIVRNGHHRHRIRCRPLPEQPYLSQRLGHPLIGYIRLCDFHIPVVRLVGALFIVTVHPFTLLGFRVDLKEQLLLLAPPDRFTRLLVNERPVYARGRGPDSRSAVSTRHEQVKVDPAWNDPAALPGPRWHCFGRTVCIGRVGYISGPTVTACPSTPIVESFA